MKENPTRLLKYNSSFKLPIEVAYIYEPPPPFGNYKCIVYTIDIDHYIMMFIKKTNFTTHSEEGMYELLMFNEAYPIYTLIKL